MRTDFSPTQLADSAIAEADTIIRSCQSYGFCTATCPTYVLLGDELDAPRGRIDLIRRMLEAGGAPDAKTVGHIDRCLSCAACEPTCAARVDFKHLVDRARAHIEAEFRRPIGDRLLRALLARVLPHPRRMRAALRLAAATRPLHRFLPGRLAGLAGLAPREVPPAGADVRPGSYPAQGPRRARVALLAGCAQRALLPSINAATLRLLARCGCEVEIAPGAGCCGSLALHMGREAEAIAAARANIDAWIAEMDGPGLDAIVINASGCGSTVKDYAHLLARDPAYRDKAARVAAIARDASETLDALGLVPRDPARPRIALAYHDACSMRNVQRVVDPPRRLLRAAGFHVRDVAEGQLCCGSAGTYNLLQPDIAERLGARKGAHIRATGTRALAVGNVGCVVQLGRHAGLPVAHTLEFLDWATGGPMPPALAGADLTPEPDLPEPGAAGAIW